MCVRINHQSVVKNNTLYIDGGKQNFINVDGINQVGNITQGINTYLITVDLSESWDWKSNISENALIKTANPQTGTTPPVLDSASLFHGEDDDDNFYLWGGTTSYFNTSFPGFEGPTPSQYSLWSYNVVSQVWDQYDVTLDSPYRPSYGSYTEARDQGLAFYFNGQLDSGSSTETQSFGNDVKQFLEGMIVIDTKNQTARNLSTTAVVGDMPRTRGGMMYIDGIADKGILVQIGGNQKPVTNTTNTYTGDLLPMNEIDIFDISSLYNASTPDGAWYKQKTSGDTPQGRVDFCLVLATAPDGSSKNIYMYGGRGSKNAYFDDIWVLSIPSFTWTKVYQGSTPRYAHTCHRVGNRTMLTVGGAANTNYDSTPCDWETKGVGVLDMSDVTWGSVYNASAGDYMVPTLVAAKIGGTPSGGANMTTPTGGFDSAGLSELFSPPLNEASPASNTSIPLPVPSDSSTSSSPSSSSSTSKPQPNPHTAPIVGSLVGGVASIALAASLGFYYRRRIRGFFTGGDFPFQEMDTENKVAEEMMARSVCWELPAGDQPIELLSPSRESGSCRPPS